MKPSRFILYSLILVSVYVLPAHAGQPVDLGPGHALFEAKKYPEAMVYFEDLFKKNPDDAGIAFHLGKSAFAAGDYEKAVQMLEQAVAMDGRQSDYYYVLGLAYARHINEVGMLKKAGIAQKMLSALQTAVQLDEKDTDARMSMISYYIAAPAMTGGSMDEAGKQLDILKAQHPGKQFWVQASYLEKEEKYGPAEEMFRQILANEKNPLNLMNLAGFLIRRERYDEAIPLLKEFLTLDLTWKDPKAAGAYFMLGYIYEKKDMKEASTAAYQAAMDNHPDKWMEKVIQKRLKALH